MRITCKGIVHVLKSDRRFEDLLRDQGIHDYRRATGKWSDFCEPVGDDDFECR